MKLSIILLTANPTEKQYAWREALRSYCDLADEVIIVDGGTEVLEYPDTKLKIITKPDPPIWTWSEHAKNLNIGLKEATGDWIIKADIDWIFHERTMATLRRKLESSEAQRFVAATMQKMTYYPGMKYIQKGEITNIINGKHKNKVQFGKDDFQYTDLTYPIFVDRIDSEGVPNGRLVMSQDRAKTGIEFWNFDYTFATREQMRRKWLRMSKSHKEYFGETNWGETESEAEKHFLNNMRGKLAHSLDIVDNTKLPKYIRERITNLQPEEFGYNGWGLL